MQQAGRSRKRPSPIPGEPGTLTWLERRHEAAQHAVEDLCACLNDGVPEEAESLLLQIILELQVPRPVDTRRISRAATLRTYGGLLQQAIERLRLLACREVVPAPPFHGRGTEAATAD